MKKILLLFFFILFLFPCSMVQAKPEDTIGFEPKKYPTPGYPMLYREAQINLDKSDGKRQKPCLVLFLHSRSRSGYDNVKHMGTAGLRTVYQYLQDNGIPAVMLAPQCPKDRRWNEQKPIHNFYMTEYLRDLMQLYIDSMGVDPERIYIFGVSMGGAGIWQMLNNYPGLFAAAMPAVSVPRSVKAGRVCKTPVFSVVGEKDELAAPEKVESFIKALQKKGGDVRYEIIPNADHKDACLSALTLERIAWVFSHGNQ